MPKTYKEAGKARKQCPKCSFYVHARSLECECGHVFKERKNPVQKQEYKDGPARGRKLCPSCNKYIGAKSKKCLCGNTQFKKTEISPSANSLYNEEIKIKAETPGAMNYVGKLVITPSGSCPYPLEEVNEESVYNWCENVFTKGLKNGLTYQESALKYWARIQFNKPEASKYIHEWAIEYGYERNFNQLSNKITHHLNKSELILTI